MKILESQTNEISLANNICDQTIPNPEKYLGPF